MPKLTRKGQVTIPLHIRNRLSVQPGDEVTFEITQGSVVVKKRASSAKNIKNYVGFLHHLEGQTADGVLEELRGAPHDPGR